MINRYWFPVSAGSRIIDRSEIVIAEQKAEKKRELCSSFAVNIPSEDDSWDPADEPSEEEERLFWENQRPVR